MLSNDQMNADALEAKFQRRYYEDTTRTIDTIIVAETDVEKLQTMYSDIAGNKASRLANRAYFEARQDQRLLNAIEDQIFYLIR